MKETKSNDNIHARILKVMQDVEAIGKEKQNIEQRYKFRGIDDMYNALHPLFKRHGIFITSEVLDSKREERTTKSGGILKWSILRCKFIFNAADGTNVSCITEGEAMDSADKATNKASSAALKYALMQMFLIPTEDLEDADKSTPEVAPIVTSAAPVSPVKPSAKNATPPIPVKVVEEDIFKGLTDKSYIEILNAVKESTLACADFSDLTKYYHAMPASTKTDKNVIILFTRAIKKQVDLQNFYSIIGKELQPKMKEVFTARKNMLLQTTKK